MAGLLGLWLAASGCEGTTIALLTPDGAQADAGPSPPTACPLGLEAPAGGAQIVVGPFAVPPASEALRCYWRKVPADVDVGQIQFVADRGSHHFHVYTVTYQMPDSDEAGFDCSDPGQWSRWQSQQAVPGFKSGIPPTLLAGFRGEAGSWPFPPGTGISLTQGRQLLIQAHTVNGDVAGGTAPAASESMSLRGCVNLYPQNSGVTQQAAMLWDEDDELVIPPKSDIQNVRYCEFLEPINVIGLLGSFNSRGLSFTVRAYDPATQEVGDVLYEMSNFAEPPLETYLDPGWDRMARPVSGIQIVAVYHNPSDQEIRWGYDFGDNEEMETMLMYYPAQDLRSTCACHREGRLPEALANFPDDPDRLREGSLPCPVKPQP